MNTIITGILLVMDNGDRVRIKTRKEIFIPIDDYRKEVKEINGADKVFFNIEEIPAQDN
jgi:hypothetical protein